MGIWEVSGSVWYWKLGRHEAPQCAERTLVFQSEGPACNLSEVFL